MLYKTEDIFDILSLVNFFLCPFQSNPIAIKIIPITAEAILKTKPRVLPLIPLGILINTPTVQNIEPITTINFLVNLFINILYFVSLYIFAPDKRKIFNSIVIFF